MTIRPRGQRLELLLAACVLFGASMAASLALFLDQPNHRVGRVAWNALYSMCAPFGGVALGILTVAEAAAQKRYRPISILVAILLLLLGGYSCVRQFPILMSV